MEEPKNNKSISQISKASKFTGKNEARRHVSQNKGSKFNLYLAQPRQVTAAQECKDDYEDDFEDLSDNEPEHKIFVNPKFKIDQMLGCAQK